MKKRLKVRIYMNDKNYMVSNYLNSKQSRIWKDGNKLGMRKTLAKLSAREEEIQKIISDFASGNAKILIAEELNDYLINAKG